MLRSASATTVIALAAASGSAFAQEAPGDPVEGEAIIVKGEKVDRSIQETTTSVSVTTAEQIAEQNIVSVQDIYNRTANMSETYGSYGFTIRGMSNRGVSGGGNGALATVYVDGAPMPTTVLHAAPSDTWDVEQVEILRGPQSTLQGLNALAGTVMIRTRTPGFDWDARAQVRAAEGDRYQLSAAGGGPLIADQLAFRVSADYRDERGFIYNPTRDAYEDQLQQINLRGKLRWTPEALPGFEAQLGFTHFDREGGYYYVYSDLGTPDPFEDRLNFSNVDNKIDSQVDIATAELRYDISPALSLTSVTSWNDVHEDGLYDGEGTAVDMGYGAQDRDYTTLTQELRLGYENDWLTGLFGLFYYDRDQTIATDSRTLVPVPQQTGIDLLVSQGGLDVATATYVVSQYVAAMPNIIVDYESNSPSNVRTMAVFGDVRVALTDRLSLIAGFRYDHERLRIEVNQTATNAGTLPDPAAFGPLAPAVAGLNQGVLGLVAQAANSTPETERSFDAFLPKGGLRYEWTDDLSTAFVVQRGYRSGGTSSNTARSLEVPYDPEYTWNYELSMRSQWLDGRLTLNANAFYVDWTDQQINVFFGLNSYDFNTVNAGKSHVYGFEVETNHYVSRNFDWYASVGHVVSEFDEFSVSQGSTQDDLTGSEFPYAPRWTVAGGVNGRFGPIVANVNASYRSGLYSSAGVDQAQVRLDSRTLVNAKISYDGGAWTAYVFADNLFDEEYIQYVNTVFNQGILGEPQVFGAGLTVGF
ncbi:TonB-dependent receptor [Sphingosinithalassobacter tenebrarum]|uniref:TonB-dependent receptor n=1 Tax=Stakelama tenebrarum TaxID=2711215 RepID=A0A6G6YA47_9SPHN|nr:TonB-dependent receptor [Sphingosinithalassobacter tenebrarum]